MARILPAGQVARLLVGAGLLLTVVLVLLSPSFGRAEPSGDYRPLLPPDALKNGCYPLPADASLDFPYQVRSDADTGTAAAPRRTLVVQYDLIDLPEAAAALTRSFVSAGFVPGTASPDGRSVTLSKPGVGTISATLTPLSPLSADQIVRGTIVLDLPRVAAASNDPICSDVTSTKRYPVRETTP